MKPTEPKFKLRKDEDYHEFNLEYCGRIIKQFKKLYFKTTSKKAARIYCKAFFPPDCPEVFWMYYIVCEINAKPYLVESIKKEAFDTLTRNIEPSGFQSVEFYTIEKNDVFVNNQLG